VVAVVAVVLGAVVLGAVVAVVAVVLGAVVSALVSEAAVRVEMPRDSVPKVVLDHNCSWSGLDHRGHLSNASIGRKSSKQSHKLGNIAILLLRGCKRATDYFNQGQIGGSVQWITIHNQLQIWRNEIKRVLSSGLIPFKKPRNTCLLLSVDCKKHVSYYRQTVLDHIAMGMLTGKLGWATKLGSRARQIFVVFGSCEI
jgi:hypothetical protein